MSVCLLHTQQIIDAIELPMRPPMFLVYTVCLPTWLVHGYRQF